MAYISLAHHRKCVGRPISVWPTIGNGWGGQPISARPTIGDGPAGQCQLSPPLVPLGRQVSPGPAIGNTWDDLYQSCPPQECQWGNSQCRPSPPSIRSAAAAKATPRAAPIETGMDYLVRVACPSSSNVTTVDRVERRAHGDDRPAITV